MEYQRNKPELLAPAGDPECLRMAVAYGADAVYLGAKSFSMRASPANFTVPQLARAVKYAHDRRVKVYLTCNTTPHNDEVEKLPRFLEEAAGCGVDALIVSDFGVMEYARRYAPRVDIHISTQAGVTNFAAANALFALGAKRIVLARELTLQEIAVIREKIPSGLAIEAFVHGAMCVSISGRCLLSEYLAARDANRGDCAQPCRWTYRLVEEKRPGRYMPVLEEETGTTILNARDLCMISHVRELAAAGISSLKIEGRAKSSYYVAAVTNAYRMAIDSFGRGEETPAFIRRLEEEVRKVSHRRYCTGFYFGPIQHGQVYEKDGYQRRWDVVAVAERCEGNSAFCRQKNAFAQGEELELLEPGCEAKKVKAGEMWDENGERIREAGHPDMLFIMRLPFPVKPFSIFRKPMK